MSIAYNDALTSNRTVYAVCWGIGIILATVISVRVLLDLFIRARPPDMGGCPGDVHAAISILDLPELFPFSHLWHKYWPDILILIVISAVFISLNIRDLDSWKYSAIGDEYAFYNSATHILDEGISEPFKPDAVDNKHPVLSSVYQVAVMAIFGKSNEIWKLSSTLAIALAIPGRLLCWIPSWRQESGTSYHLLSSHSVTTCSPTPTPAITSPRSTRQ